MKIAIIVLNYNKKDLLKKCLFSLNKLNYENYKVIVVDNGSKDDSVEMIKNNFKNVQIVEVGYNSGFCKGNNLGIDYVLKNNYDGVIILNNDTEVEPNFVSEIVKKIDLKNKIGMISMKVLLISEPKKIDNVGFLVTPDGLGKNLGAGEKEDKYNFSREVFCPSGAATFYCRDLLQDIKQDGQYFDEDFEFCYEELDLGWRARLKGWKCLFSPGAIVYHHKSATAGAYSDKWAYYCNRNIFFNIIKNYPSALYLLKALGLSFFRYVFLVVGLRQKRGIGHEISKRSGLWKTIRIFFKSEKDSLLKMKIMLAKRKKIQGRKKVSKEEISRWFSDLGISFFDSIYKL